MRSGRPLVKVVRLGLLSYQEGLRLQRVYVDRHRSARPLPAAVRAQSGLHHGDPARTVPRLPAGPAPPPRGRRSPRQPRRTHHLPRAGSAGVLPGPGPERLQKERALVRVSAGADRHLCVQQLGRGGDHVPAHRSLGRRQQDLRHRDPLRPLHHLPRPGSELPPGPVLVLPHRPVRHRGQRRDVAQQGAAPARERARGHAPPAPRLRRAFRLPAERRGLKRFCQNRAERGGLCSDPISEPEPTEMTQNQEPVRVTMVTRRAGQHAAAGLIEPFGFPASELNPEP